MANLHTGFENQNAQSDYPFLPGCSRRDADNNVLPPWFIVDVGLSIPPGSGQVHLASAYIGEHIWSATFALGADTVLIATASVSDLRRSPGLAVPMTPLVPGAAGTLLFGAPEPDALYTTRYTYPNALADNTRLLPSVVRTARYMPVKSLHTGPANSLYARSAVGAVTLDGRGDVVVDTDPVNANNIIFRLAASRERYLSVCDRPAGTLPPPIRTVNSVKPDADGLLTIRLVAPGELEES